MRAAVLVLVCALLMVVAASAQDDLRERFGTRSLEAAQKLAFCLDCLNARKHKDALAAAQSAIKFDSKCQIAYLFRGVAQGELGDIDESIESYKACLGPNVNGSRELTAMASVNLALTLVKVERFDESQYYFSVAIMADFTGEFKQRGLAYRNLGLQLRHRGQHMASALATMMAYQDRVADISPRWVAECIDKAEDQEVGVLMSYGRKVPKLIRRAHKTALSEVKVEGIAEPVSELWPDPRGKFVIAACAGADHYYVLSTEDRVKLSKVAAPAKIRATAFAGGSLYVLSTDGVRIERLDPLTGKSQWTTKLVGEARSESLAVLPSVGLAAVCVDDVVQLVELGNGKLTRMSIPGQVVVAHPDQKSVYSFLKPKQGRNPSYLLIDGQPTHLRRKFDPDQATLYHSAVTPAGLVPIAVRENAAVTAVRMSVSPDGKWVAVAGTGGYHPRSKGEGGNGVGVFAADDLGHRQGYFKTGASSHGVCFNPVNAQVTAVRDQEAYVHHLADPGKAEVIKGKFSGPSTFSGNGRYLVLATEGKGLAVFDNSLSEDEQKFASTWYKTLDLPVATLSDKTKPTVTRQPVVTLAQFEPRALKRGEVSSLFVAASKSGRTELAANWQEYAGYIRDEPARRATEETASALVQASDFGIAIYKARNHLKKHVDQVPLEFFLAECLQRGGQADKAVWHYLSVVRKDQARTELTPRALNELAEIFARDKKPMEALHCAGTSLSLDRARPATLALAKRLLEAEKFVDEAKAIGTLSGIKEVNVGKLPSLSKPTATDKKLTSRELFQSAAKSVVIVESRTSSGSGVCVARSNIIVTNEHVVRGAEVVTIVPFKMNGKEVERQPKLQARVVYSSSKEDIAVLQLERGDLVPLDVSAEDSESGTKVFAVGHPGLGDRVLDLSISEGLISSTKRELDGMLLLQHSAAINPGNSGGPLLDEHGRVVGIVTFKAKLENVSFAVRVATLRRIFPTQ